MPNFHFLFLLSRQNASLIITRARMHALVRPPFVSSHQPHHQICFVRLGFCIIAPSRASFTHTCTHRVHYLLVIHAPAQTIIIRIVRRPKSLYHLSSRHFLTLCPVLVGYHLFASSSRYHTYNILPPLRARTIVSCFIALHSSFILCLPRRAHTILFRFSPPRRIKTSSRRRHTKTSSRRRHVASKQHLVSNASSS
jgi:hypothetical protein